MPHDSQHSDQPTGPAHDDGSPPGTYEDIRLPRLTHLQFLVAFTLTGGHRSGRNLRRSLARAGIEKSGPAFYQLMSRMEQDGYVRGWYEQRVIDSHEFRERRYELTSDGMDAWDSTCDFYRHYMAAEHDLSEV